MNVTAPARIDFQVVCKGPGPRFLGLDASERNRRVARRHGAIEPGRGAALPTLVVPAGVAITPALFPLLPAPEGVWHLVWEPASAPIEWRGVGTGSTEPPRLTMLPAGVALDLSTRPARRRSAWQLLRASGKPADGWLSRHLHRRVSRLFSYAFLSAGLSANVATFATFGIGVGSGWLMAQTSQSSMIAAAFLFWFASIADGIDGEMARLTLSESRFGEQLDTGVDQLTYLFALAGALVGWSRQGIEPAGVALAAVVVIGVPAALFWAMRMVRKARQTNQRFVPMTPIEGAVFAAARGSRSPVLRAAAAVFVLFRREAFSLAFFLVSFVTGSRAIYPVLLACGLGIVLLTFLLHGGVLAQELKREFA